MKGALSARKNITQKGRVRVVGEDTQYKINYVGDLDMSPSLGKLAEALAKAQGEMEPATKDAKNPFFNSKYADLGSVWDAVRKPLSSNGLSIIQQPGNEGEHVLLTTMLLHSSGEWIRSTVGAIPTKKDPQGVGSCLTYLRRYSLSAVVGVSTEDDDGNAASEPVKKPSVKKEIKEMDNHVKETAKPKTTPDSARASVIALILGTDKYFGANMAAAKKWMEEQAKRNFDEITVEECRDMYKAATELKK